MWPASALHRSSPGNARPSGLCLAHSGVDDIVKRIKDAQDGAYKVGPSFLPIMSWYAYTSYWNFVKNVKVLGDTSTSLSGVWLDLSGGCWP